MGDGGPASQLVTPDWRRYTLTGRENTHTHSMNLISNLFNVISTGAHVTTRHSSFSFSLSLSWEDKE